MTSPDINNSEDEVKVIDRKKFLLATGAAAGAATLFGSAPKAYATDMNYAYWDAVQTFTADQYFGNVSVVSGLSKGTGQVYFKSGQPWVDVKAFGAVGDGTTNDQPAIMAAINAAISTASNTYGNPIIYFPPGDYVIAQTITIPNNSSNFCLMGAGSQSSRIVWGDTAMTTGQAMLQLNNAWQVHIKDLGFTISTTITGVQPPQYGIQVYRMDGPIEAPSLLLVERVFIGSTTSPSVAINTAIVFNCYSAADWGNNDQATFRDVSIQYVSTGYCFGATNALIHTIIGGSVQNCSTAAIDNTPLPYTNGDTKATLGGSYTVFGTRFASNALTFQIAPTPVNDNIDIIGIRAGTLANPETALLATAATPINQPQAVSFIGGSAILKDPGTGSSVSFNSIQGPLEFHGFRMTSPTGVALSFPNTGAVNFYGGKLYTKTCQYGGSLHFHGTAEMNASPVFTLAPGMVLPDLRQIGYNNHLSGASSNTATFAPSLSGSALGGTGTVSGTGTNLGGTITVKIPAGDVTSSGILAVVSFGYDFFPSTAQVMFTAANAAAAGAMNLIYSTTVVNSPPALNGQIQVKVSAGLTVPSIGTTTYTWNYFLLT